MSFLFSLLHATARVPGWERAAELWLERCDQPKTVEHVIALERWCDIDTILPVSRVAVVPGSRGGVDQWNKAAEISTGEILIMMADDLFPPEHWDSYLAAFVSSKAWGGGALFGADGSGVIPPIVLDVSYQSAPGRPVSCHPLIPHPIISRAYYQQFGYFLHPDYKHTMCDVEFTEVARSGKYGAVVDARKLVFTHENPDDGSAQWDEVYRRHRTPIALDDARRVYEWRKALGFPRESILCGDVGPGGAIRCDRLRGHTHPDHYSSSKLPGFENWANGVSWPKLVEAPYSR